MTAVSAVVHCTVRPHTDRHTHTHTEPQTTVHFELSQKRWQEPKPIPWLIPESKSNSLPTQQSNYEKCALCVWHFKLNLKFQISNATTVHTPYPAPFCLCCCAFPNCSIRNVCNSFGLNPELKLKIFSKNCAALRCFALLCSALLTTLRHVATEVQREVFGGWATQSRRKRRKRRQRSRIGRRCQSGWANGGTKVIATGNAKDNNAKVWLLLRCSKGAKVGRREGAGQTETEAHWAKLLQLLAFVSSLQEATAPAKQFKLNKRTVYTLWTIPFHPFLPPLRSPTPTTDTSPDTVKYTYTHIPTYRCVSIFENLLKSLASDLCSTFQKLFFLIDLKFRQRIANYLTRPTWP